MVAPINQDTSRRVVKRLLIGSVGHGVSEHADYNVIPLKGCQYGHSLQAMKISISMLNSPFLPHDACCYSSHNLRTENGIMKTLLYL